MKRDKEQFKSKVRDENYIKDKRPDVQLGRHTDIVQNKPTSQSKKNRMYQARQESQTETAAVNTETPYAADMQTKLSEPEQQKKFSETAELEQLEADRDIPKSEQPKQPQKAKRQIYHQHTHNVKKSADLGIPQEPDAKAPPPSVRNRRLQYP